MTDDDLPDLPEVNGPGSSATSVEQRAVTLRVWREQTGQLQAAVARAAGLSDSTLSAWERGDRGSDLIKSRNPLAAVRLIGAKLGAPVALPDLWAAVGTVDALPPRSDWARNFSPAGQPCWVWIRCTRESRVDAQWSVAVQGNAVVPAGVGGLLIQFPTSVHNPPLELSLSSPGWVDAGGGEVPPAVAQALGAQWVDARDLHRPQRVGQLGAAPAGLAPAVGMIRAAASWFSIRWDVIAPHVADVLRTTAPEYALDRADLAATIRAGVPDVDEDGLVVRQLLLTGAQLRALRVARGLSREGAVQAANDLRRNAPLSRSGLQRLEEEEVLPRADHALARLDSVYASDGRLGLERTYLTCDHQAEQVRGDRRRWEVDFPSWWIGPVWLQALGTAGRTEEATLTLQWGPWVRRQRILGGLVVTTRKAPPLDRDLRSEPLRVELPAGWRFIAGTGAVPTALDIGRHWQPRSLAAAVHLVETVVRAVRPGQWALRA